MLQRHLSEPEPPADAVGVFVYHGGDGKPPVAFGFGPGGDLPPGVERIDPVAFRQRQAEEAQALSRQINDLRRRLFKPDGRVPPEQYEALLCPLAQRLFLSTRFQEAVEKWPAGKN